MPSKIEPNSLDRFSKGASRLVLEQFTSCEVPAGCGGVVYRWRRADRDVVLGVTVYSPGEVKAWVDGEEVQSTHIDLASGPHVLGLHFSDSPATGPLFLLAATAGFKGNTAVPLFHSRADGTWLYRLSDPGEGWMVDAPEGWQTMEKGMKFTGSSTQELSDWRYRHLREAKAQPLKSPGPGPVWVRRAFVLEGGS